MGRVIHARAEGGGERKARGAFFTPPALADFLAGWAVRGPMDRIIDPSCGEAALLSAAGRRLRALGGGGAIRGLDLHAPSIDAARALLAADGLDGDLAVADFFDADPTPFDAVIGNPPYIRYQSFAGEERLKAQRIALAGGVRLGGLANAWAAFVVHASRFLGEGGRLALVLPAVLLSVNYAAPIRRFLLERFSSVKLVLFKERVFPGVIEEVVLLLAEGSRGASGFEVVEVKDLAGLEALAGPSEAQVRPWSPLAQGGKWTEALVSPEAASVYADLSTGSGFLPLSTWGDTDLGMVTGNNQFFTLTGAEVEALHLSSEEVLRISPPGSRHLRGIAFTDRVFAEMASAGCSVYLFYPDKHSPSDAARRHIETGEQRGVHQAYKCAIRSPWWRVPLVRVPDLFLTYMNHDTPRLVRNEARAAYLNSIHGVTLKPHLREVGADLLPLAMLNSVTMLGAELCGRSYGGGILKVEPKEASRLPMPSPAILAAAGAELRNLGSSLSPHLRDSDLDEVVRGVDDILLTSCSRIGEKEVSALRGARQAMVARRAARSGNPRRAGSAVRVDR